MMIEMINLQLCGVLLLTESLGYNKECYVYTYLLSIYNKPIFFHDIRYTVNIWQLGIDYFFFFFMAGITLSLSQFKSPNVLVRVSRDVSAS